MRLMAICGDLNGQISVLSADTPDEKSPQGDIPSCMTPVIIEAFQLIGKPSETL